ncbi:hypothetical protein CDAR_458832 [Caerostris darwini]|uniref:Centrosome-associated protein 350 n=1 Tax=Caerostris darwini TaxID=1538125 RepID=A0AAV4MQ10_9ARAC|nr:hypothetical protein CDAR_458832 [Caerostris darwini]
MYKSRGTTWIGFEEAQRTIDSLKAEVQIAENKLSTAKRSLKLEKNKPVSPVPPNTESPYDVLNISKKKEDFGRFIKESPSRIQSHKKHIKKRRKLTIPKDASDLNSEDDKLQTLPLKNLSYKQFDTNETLAKSAADNLFTNVSSSEASNSILNLKQQTTSEKTSSFIKQDPNYFATILRNVPKDTGVLNNEEDQLLSLSPKNLSSELVDTNEALVKSVFDSPFSNILSDDISNSILNLKHQLASSENTSSLIADTYNNSDAQLSNIIYRKRKKKIENPSKITFTWWEKDFLRDQIGVSDIDGYSSQVNKSVSSMSVNGIQWTPIINEAKVPILKPKKFLHGNLKTLQLIIDRQKKFYEKIQDKSELDTISSSSYREEQAVEVNKNKCTIKVNRNKSVIENRNKSSVAIDSKDKQSLENLIPNNFDPSIHIKPLPVRKKCLVTNLPKYRGFSVPGSRFTTPGRKNLKSTKKLSHINKENKSPILKRIKKNISNKEGDSHQEKEKQTIHENKEQYSRTKSDIQSKESTSPNSNSPNSNNERSSSSNDKTEETKSKINDVKEELKTTISPDLNLSSDNESDLQSTENNRNIKEHPKFTAMSKSVKRKAKKFPDENITPSPKMRHYDPQTVRDYIKKKKEERRKRHLEERKKTSLEAQRKKESLQKLYEYQKETIMLGAKSPSNKVCKKRNEPASKNIGEFLPISNSTADFVLKQENKNTKIKDFLVHEKKSIAPLINKKKDMIFNNAKESQNHAEEDNLFQLDMSAKPLSESEKQKFTSDVPLQEKINAEVKSKILKEKKFSSPIETPSTSFHNVAENKISYISTISTPSTLSELSDINKISELKYEKLVIPKGQSKQAQTLKNLVKSIDEMTEPFEYLIRTKKWIEDSPPPPDRRSNTQNLTKKFSTSSHHLERNSKIMKESSTDFAIDYIRPLHSTEGNSFKQQVSNVGDTSQLFEKLLGRRISESSRKEKFDAGKTIDSEKSFNDYSNPQEELIEGSIDSEEETTNENHHQSLIEGTLISEGDSTVNEKEVPSFLNSNQTEVLPPLENQAWLTTNFLNVNPDPFNFINTWNRKPLDIPGLDNSILKGFQNPSSVADKISSVEEKSSDQGSYTISPSTQNESFISESISNTALNSSPTISEHFSNFNEYDNLNNQIQNMDERKHSDVLSSENRSAKSAFNSVLSSNASENMHSDHAEKKIESKTADTTKKELSPSESSISEMISVIEKSKNDEAKSIKMSKKNKESSSGAEVSSENIINQEKKSENDVPELSLLSSNEMPSNNSVQDLIKNESLSNKDTQEISEVSSITDKDTKSNYEELNVTTEKNSESSESITEQNKVETVSSIKSPNSVTIDFAQPVRFTLSDGVSKSLKVHKDVQLHEEQYFHTQVVTRVASEAAAAAATSAVIAVFETQRELLKNQNATNYSTLTSTASDNSSQQSKSNSVSSHKSSSNVSTVIESNPSKSSVESSVIGEANDNPNPVATMIEKNHSEIAENNHLSGSFSKSNKISSSSVITEDLHVSEKSEELQKRRIRKISGNLSSPSPASLSENESLSYASFMRENSSLSSSTITESALSDDSFAQLTLDVVRKITHEEELRASHQLALLKFQEQTLVENARAAMTWLESLKKNFREKGANKKASFIKKKQKDIVLRLRQERAQLRCMQEAYRSICDKHHTLVTDKKKLLNESIFVPPQTSKNASLSSKASSQQKTKNYVKQKSDSSSTSTVLTEEEIRKSVEEEVPEEILEIKNEASHSSQGSILELVSSEPVISSQPSYDKLQEAASLPQLKQGHSQSSLSLHSNNSIESALQGLKKLEASKRHLTKREQRILQRRKHVEKILQWQMKLDSEELAVRELEQKAVELVDTSKKKTKYYISTSPSAIQDEKENTPSNGIPEYSVNPSDSLKASASSDYLSSKKISSEEVPESVPSDSVPEENIVTATSGESVEEEFSKKRSNGQESPSTMSSSSIQEMDQNQSTESSIKTTEEAAESSNTKVIVTNGRSHSPKSSATNKSSSSDIYSESFESTASQKGSSPSISLVAIRTSIPSSSGRKEKDISIKSPLAPRNFRRHDSSGSDDSYTISHSETASDQSDIEVRIHALAEELRRRKYEAEKLKREQKRKYREHLKGTELSLKKQVEAYTQYIQQVKSDLEHIETMSSQSQSGDISSVKPQIKWPRLERVIDSRHIRKKTPLSSEALTPEKKTFDNTTSSPDSIDSTIDLSHKRGKPFMKKLFPDSKEKLKHEIGLSKEISSKAVVPETIFEKVSENISSLENSEKNLSTVTENLDILMKTSPVKKSSLNGNKSFSESKESEIEEESYESNSSVITVDSKSEPNKAHTDESNSKFTYQSDSFVINSSTSKSSHEHGQELDNLKSSSVLDVVPPETLNTRNSAEDSEETLQDSFKSHTSDQIATNDSILSSEVEYVSESLSNTNAGSVKDELESGSFEYENSDADSTSSPRKLLDKTFNVESDSKTNFSPVDDISLTETKSVNQREQQELSKKSIDESVHVVTTNDKKSLKEGLKSQTFVVNVVNYIHSSILDDAIRTMLNLSKKCSNTSKSKNLSHSLIFKQLNEESVEILVNDLLNSHINEAISFVFNISNNYKKFQNGFMKPSSLTENYREHELTSTCSGFSINAIDFDTQNYENNELKNAHSATTLNDYNIFKKQADWFEDGFVSAQWDAQQLEQQLLLQQYPYYYRKIPNKPPPPYTPPTVLSINYPLPIKKEKIVEQADPIKFVTKHIGLIIDNIAEVLISGKKNGQMINEITEIDFSSVVKHLNLTLPCQLTFLDLIFDLTKETALDIFSEIEENPAPWLRPRKLTPKPKFPTDKNQLISSVQKKVEQALKIAPTESSTEQNRKRPTWATMKLGRKKRDFVDTILISEIKEEEPDWVYYDQDEATVKFQIADSIFDLLVDDTANLIKDLSDKKYW